jgi:hypothetical protein
MLIPLGILASSGAVAGAYELIETEILGTAQASVVFSGLGAYSSTYKHLQIRMVTRSSAASNSQPALQINGVSSTAYSEHQLDGNGTTVSSFGAGSTTRIPFGIPAQSGDASSAFTAYIVDILDAYSTTKNKTIRVLKTNPRVSLHSGAWFNTASVTSLDVFMEFGNHITGSRFSLYGIRG